MGLATLKFGNLLFMLQITYFPLLVCSIPSLQIIIIILTAHVRGRYYWFIMAFFAVEPKNGLKILNNMAFQVANTSWSAVLHATKAICPWWFNRKNWGYWIRGFSSSNYSNYCIILDRTFNLPMSQFHCLCNGDNNYFYNNYFFKVIGWL